MKKFSFTNPLIEEIKPLPIYRALKKIEKKRKLTQMPKLSPTFLSLMCGLSLNLERTSILDFQKIELTGNEFFLLINMLKTNETIVHLNLDYSNLSDTGLIRKFVKVLIKKESQQGQTIQKLSLMKTQLSQESYLDLSNLIKANLKTLKSINLKFNLIKDQGLKLLSGALIQNDHLERISLTSKYLSCEGIEQFLIKVYKNNKSLKNVDLKYSRLEPNSKKKVFTSLKSCDALEQLTLSHYALKKETNLKILSQVLRRNDQIRNLDLSWNLGIEKKSRNLLIKSLCSNDNLKVLRLNNLSLDDQDCLYLTQYMGKNRSLETLEMMDHCISAVSLDQFLRKLISNKSRKLTSIALGSQTLDFKSAHAISRWLTYDSMIQRLDLRSCRLCQSEELCQAISGGFQKNASLEMIILEAFQITPKIAKMLLHPLKNNLNNNCLKNLHLTLLSCEDYLQFKDVFTIILDCVSNLPNLETLSLPYLFIDNQNSVDLLIDFLHSSGSQSIKKLEIPSSRFSDKQLAKIIDAIYESKFLYLEKLDLSENQIGVHTLQALIQLFTKDCLQKVRINRINSKNKIINIFFQSLLKVENLSSSLKCIDIKCYPTLGKEELNLLYKILNKHKTLYVNTILNRNKMGLDDDVNGIDVNEDEAKFDKYNDLGYKIECVLNRNKQMINNNLTFDLWNFFKSQKFTDLKLYDDISVHSWIIKQRVTHNLKQFQLISKKYKKREIINFLFWVYTGNFDIRILPIAKEFDIQHEYLIKPISQIFENIFENDNRISDFSLITKSKRVLKLDKFLLLARTQLFRNFFLSLSQSCGSVSDYSKKNFRTLQVFFKYLYTDNLELLPNDDRKKIYNQLADSHDYYIIFHQDDYLNKLDLFNKK
ncbi:ran gtpase-activating protein [Anaeramoeba flamelloides]|uniref:Ran gtpase-activating protein n=1 Tax=Anaeramoeba flamelloides TaxID=1746091 RepID=A0AAV7YSJ2_9EUKA|nr:ran gtpase-activating protein [Anaeramoeba flamelloides]